MQTQKSRKDNLLSRDELIEAYLPHVKRIVHRIAIHLPSHVEIDDLIHVGVIGLMQAIERYDSSRNNTFLTYAVFRIKGAVLSELRSRDFLSRANRRKVRELDRAYMGLEQKKGRAVDDRELAEEIGVPLEEVQEIKKMSSISFVSFEEMGIQTEDEKRSVVDALLNNGSDDALTLTRVKEMKSAVAEAIEQLPEKEKLVISLYYVDELTMKETGKALNITESRVSQIHSQAVVHLRSHLRKRGLL